MRNKLSASIQAKKDTYWASAHKSFYYTPDIEAYTYAAMVSQGIFPSEHQAGFCVFKPTCGEIIPLVFHIPHNLRKLIHKKAFTFTTNQYFAKVLKECAAPRPDRGEDDYWIFDRTKRNLNILHNAGAAHSVETYYEGRQVAGAIGIQVNGIYTSLTTYSRESGAGNATFIALQAILCRRDFKLHDAMMPSNLSSSFGGQLINKEQNLIMRREAMQCEKPCMFPHFDKPLPILAYSQPLLDNPTQALIDIPTVTAPMQPGAISVPRPILTLRR